MDTPTQTLSGQWAFSSFPANFGFALRGNTDLDHNGYPGTADDRWLSFVHQHWQPAVNPLYLLADLIVGAFGVDKAVLYRFVCYTKQLLTERIWNPLVFRLIPGVAATQGSAYRERQGVPGCAADPV